MDFTKHDALIAELLPKLETYQEEYKKTNLKYWQGLSTLEAPPEIDTTATKLDSRPPTKLSEPTWTDTLLITKDLPFSVAVDEQTNPLGWLVRFETSDGKDTYRKCVLYPGGETEWTLMQTDGNN